MELIKRYGYRIGLGIVLFTHLYMAIYGLPDSQHMAHYIANIVAVILIYFGEKTSIF